MRNVLKTRLHVTCRTCQGSVSHTSTKRACTRAHYYWANPEKIKASARAAYQLKADKKKAAVRALYQAQDQVGRTAPRIFEVGVVPDVM